MPKYLLEFEKPLRELEKRIEATKVSALERGIDMSKEIKSQQDKLAKVAADFYKNLTRWQRVQMARHPERPHALDYIDEIVDNWFELHGDRLYGDDKAIIGGTGEIGGRRLMIIGQQKGRGTKDNLYRNFGMPNPEGYRKALRLMRLAEKFNIPVLSFIDTTGAYPGLGAEERGQAEAIARNLFVMSTLRVPIILIVIGEGASGGALGIGVGDKMLMLENTWFSVISPEGCASILYRDAGKASKAADAMRIVPTDLVEMGICDEILLEPLGGAHQALKETALTVKKAILDSFNELDGLTTDELIARRIAHYDKLGQWQE